MSSTILFEQYKGIARLCFNRPDRHNALGTEELAAIEWQLARLSSDARVLIISSESGRTFCAGADLEQISAGTMSGDHFQRVTNLVAEVPIPTLCVLNGNVFGGGFELAMSCDFRIGAEDIMMRVPAAAIGLCYPTDGIIRLVRRLGVTTAKRVLIGAEEFSAQEMKALGMLDWVAAPANLMQAATDAARQIARHAPLATQSMLKIIKQAEAGMVDPEEAAKLVELCAKSDDLQEGLTAKRERRAPQFAGR